MKDQRFKFVRDFKLTVPENYNHATQLTSFRKKNYDKFYFYNNGITDKNFRNVSAKLIPGQKFLVKIFENNVKLSSKDCIEFLRSQKAIFTGAQGLTLLWEEKQKELPIGKWIISFDEEDSLWNAGDFSRAPFLDCIFPDSWEFRLSHFEDIWGTNRCLLCFCRYD